MTLDEATAFLDAVLDTKPKLKPSRYYEPDCVAALSVVFAHEKDGLIADYAMRFKNAQASWKDLKKAATKPCISVEDAGRYPYLATDEGTFVKQAGGARILLANFHAQVTEEIECTDGAKTQILVKIEVSTCFSSKKSVTLIEPFESFYRMDWTKKLGVKAVVAPQHNALPLLRHAVQLRSHGALHTHSYAHTGWIRAGDKWLYLTPEGAIGAQGLNRDVSVKLPEQSSLIDMKAPAGVQLDSAIQSVLCLAKEIPAKIILPLICAAFRAALNIIEPVDFSLWLCGESGGGKSAMAAYALGFYSRQVDWKNLPLNFVSTANSTEKLLHNFKDTLMVIDDFNRRGSKAANERQEEVTDRVVRGLANRNGRARCNVDLEVQQAYYPRCFLIGTAEELPSSYSLVARTLVISIKPKEVTMRALTNADKIVKSGTLVVCMQRFIQWLAHQADDGRLELLREQLSDARKKYQEGDRHRRSNEQLANLEFAFSMFSNFVADVEPELAKPVLALKRQCAVALSEVGALQPQLHDDLRPEKKFLRLLDAALLSGHGHLLWRHQPKTPLGHGWGWDAERALGGRLGWLDETVIYLNPQVSLTAASEEARRGGDTLEVTIAALGQRLRDNAMLARFDQETGRGTAKVQMPGVGRSRVWCVKRELLGRDEQDVETDDPNAPAKWDDGVGRQEKNRGGGRQS